MTDTEHYTRRLTNRELKALLAETPDDADLLAEAAHREEDVS